jgi:hypothetical protein
MGGCQVKKSLWDGGMDLMVYVCGGETAEQKERVLGLSISESGYGGGGAVGE